MSEENTVVWRTLDHGAEIDISYRQLPHWDQTGALTFVTFRLADSLPRPVLEVWQAEQSDWLRRNGIQEQDVAHALEDSLIAKPLRRQLEQFSKRRWNDHLDACHGRCLLRELRFSQIVGDSLLKFDGERYDLERFVVMPNHVHLLVQMRPGFGLRKQCTNWMRYTGRQINQLTGNRGTFWQSEPFDHVVRSSDQFEYLRKYIADNPVKARLKPSDYLSWQRS